jgi:hypothetical protein
MNRLEEKAVDHLAQRLYAQWSENPVEWADENEPHRALWRGEARDHLQAIQPDLLNTLTEQGGERVGLRVLPQDRRKLEKWHGLLDRGELVTLDSLDLAAIRNFRDALRRIDKQPKISAQEFEPEYDDGASGDGELATTPNPPPNRLSRDDGEVTVSLSREEIKTLIEADAVGEIPHGYIYARKRRRVLDKLRTALQAALVQGDSDAQD